MFGKKKEKKVSIYKFYDEEEARLLAKLAELESGTDSYKETQSELRAISQMRAESKESKRRISKEGKVSLAASILGFTGGVIGLFGVIKAERDGLTFTGEKRTIMDSICRGIGQIFNFRRG